MSLHDKIAKQIEFYFSDSNLPRDKFLKELADKDEDGWVPLEVLTTFKRLKKLSEDREEIVQAIKTVNGEVVELNEDSSKIRRNPSRPLPSDAVINERSIYAKGFPLETTTLDSVTDFFTNAGFKVLSVRLRRTLTNKEFKGSVFVELESKDEVEKAVAAGLKIDDVPLLVETKNGYFERKKQEKAERKKSKKSDNDDGEEAEKEGDAKDSNDSIVQKGHVLHFKGCSEGTNREMLKESFGKHGDIAWVDFMRNDTEGYIRFKENTKAEDVLKAATEAKMEVNGNELELRLVDGDEEDEYLKKASSEAQKARKDKRNNKGGRGRGRGGRGGRHGNRGGKRGNDDDGSRAKRSRD